MAARRAAVIHFGFAAPGFTGCGKTLATCHSERSEESQQFVKSSNYRDPSSPAAPQDDSPEEFFRSLFTPAQPQNADPNVGATSSC
jgi:hypothetical protein